MILTTCAACAAPLAHDAPRCVRCHLRYCNKTCQHDHWRRGHKQMCKKIHRGGNAEQYHADKKYKEAVAVAVEACDDDTKGQTCYICLESVHPHTKEGLVRGCACQGDQGFAHVSCLADQAKILFADARENTSILAQRMANCGNDVITSRWEKWHKCSLCKQRYRGPVLCALGWACWKTYASVDPLALLNTGKGAAIPEAMGVLGLCLSDAGHRDEAFMVGKALAHYTEKIKAEQLRRSAAAEK